MSFKKSLESKEYVFGTWSMMSSPIAAHVIGCTNLDYLVIDMEHGAMSYQTAENILNACLVNKLEPIIRTSDNNPSTILHCLEIGARTILVPHISTIDTAKSLASSVKYFPDGNRGLSPYTRNHLYTHKNLSDSLHFQNQTITVGAMVEGVEGINNLKAICTVDGIDIIYLGSYDLSQSAGYPGNFQHPNFKKKVREACEIIKMSGKYAGIFANNIADCKKYIEHGYKFIAYVADSFALKAYYEHSIEELKSIL